MQQNINKKKDVAHVARKVMSCHMYKIGGKVKLGESWTLPSASKWRLIQEQYTKEQEEVIAEVYVAHLARTVRSCHMYKIGGKVKL